MVRKHVLTVAVAASLLAAPIANADTIKFWTMEIQPDRMEKQEKLAADFEAATGHTVEVIPVEEAEISTRATAAFAAGDLPDVLNHTVQHLLPFAEAGILDTGAATDGVGELGDDTYAAGPLNMAKSNGEIVSVPTDGWTQLVVYRSDLFEEAGLNPPKSFADIQTAIDKLHLSLIHI